MRNLLRAVLICIALVAMIPATWIAIYAAQRALGYFPGGHFPTIAQYAAEQGDVRLCRRIIGLPWPTVGGPSTADARLSCIHDYASLTKDPSVCELLMPTDYGFSCLGAVSGKLFAGQHCTRSGSLDHVVVYCNRESEGEVTIDRPQIDDCSLYERRDLREWCYNTRTELKEDAHECKRISHPIMYDECEYNYALKQRDPSLCSPIKDEKRRDFCTLYVELSVKYH